MTENQMNFPPLKNERVLKAIKGEKPDKIPVWIMRQAGRHMKEFREFRKKHSFFEICQKPELACEVTLMPIRRYDLDAAIIFSDILVIPQALGMEVIMEEGVGPVFSNPLTIETLENLNFNGAVDRLKYVGEAITLTRHKLEGKVPLFGFTGAPWTLMGYMIEGKSSKTFSKAKKWLYCYPEESDKLLTSLTNVIVDYLIMQIKAGAQIVQIFESSAEYLNEELFDQCCKPYLIRIAKLLHSKLEEMNIKPVPMVLFAKGSFYSLSNQKDYGYDMIGVDWTITPSLARKILGEEIAIQGNLDPCALYGSPESIKTRVRNMITGFGTHKYVVNLGHGIYPDMEESAVEAFIEAVHNFPL